MNIFVLDLCPNVAAQYHCDKHVIKMILETGQILCTCLHQQGIEAPYKATHKNRPCTLWAGWSKSNYIWLWQLGYALCEEYTYRYGKRHKTQSVIEICAMQDKYIPDGEPTPFALVMPDKYKSDNVVESYRRYYREDKCKNIQCVWTKRDVPSWFSE